MSYVAENILEIIGCLYTEKDLRRVTSLVEKLLANRHFEEIRTVNSRTRIRGLDFAARDRIRKYEVRPLVIKGIVPHQRVQQTYDLQSHLYHTCPVKIAAVGKTNKHLLELDYRAMGWVPLNDFLAEYSGSRKELAQQRISQMQVIMDGLAAFSDNYVPRPPHPIEVVSLKEKWLQSIRVIGHNDLDRLTESIFVNLSQEPWEPYRDPSDANILLLDDRLCHIDFERVDVYIPRSLHRLHDLISPGMGYSVRQSQELLELDGLLAGAIYRCARELHHVVKKGEKSAYFSGCLEEAVRLFDAQSRC